jgi:hypothetical protein
MRDDDGRFEADKLGAKRKDEARVEALCGLRSARGSKGKVSGDLGWTVKECQYFVATDAGGVKAVCECSSLTLRPPRRGRRYDMKDQGIPARQIVHLLGFLALQAVEALIVAQCVGFLTGSLMATGVSKTSQLQRKREDETDVRCGDAEWPASMQICHLGASTSRR